MVQTLKWKEKHIQYKEGGGKEKNHENVSL